MERVRSASAERQPRRAARATIAALAAAWVALPPGTAAAYYYLPLLQLPSGAPQNAREVAAAINGYVVAGNTVPTNFQGLYGLTPTQLAGALQQNDGEVAVGARYGAFNLTSQFLGLMTDPFLTGRTGFGGGSVTGFAAENDALPPELAAAYAAVFKAPAAKPAAFDQRWVTWGSAYGSSSHLSGDQAGVGSVDTLTRTGGIVAGAEYLISPASFIGFSLGGGGTNWGLGQGLGTGRSDALQLGIYGKSYFGPAYVAASITYSEYWMSTDRMAFASNHLTASFNAQSYGGRGEAGYRIASPLVAVTPYAAVQSQAFVTPGYSETDVSGGGFGMTYAGATATDTRGEAGAWFDHATALSPTAVLTLRGKLAYAHDWVSDPALAATFQALQGSRFVVTGAEPPPNSALMTAGAEVHFASGLEVGTRFDSELAAHGQTYVGTGFVRYLW